MFPDLKDLSIQNLFSLLYWIMPRLMEISPWMYCLLFESRSL